MCSVFTISVSIISAISTAIATNTASAASGNVLH
jgi:hypothetical protein